MKRSLIILFAFLFPIALYSQQEKPPVMPRMLQVKIKESDVAKVQASRLSVSSDSAVNLGIQRLDVLNKQFGVSEMKRVFPFAGEYEEKHRKYGFHLWYELALDEDIDPVLAADFYKATGAVENAEPVYRVVRIDGLASKDQDSTKNLDNQPTPFGISPSAIPNDPYFSKQWHYHNDGTIVGSKAGVDISLNNAWDIATGSKKVIVAILDGGIDYTHEDLAANMWVNAKEIQGNGIDDDGNGFVDDVYGYDFYGKTGNITADNHGTHVAGTVGAVSGNGKGVAGVAGGESGANGVQLMSCQIFQANGSAGATSLDIKRAFIYAADHGAVICQNSWGYETPNHQGEFDLEGIRYFIKEAGTDANGNPRPNTLMVGGIVIFAAGNVANRAGYDPSNKYYPQAYPEVIAVSAIGPDGKRARYANYGDWVDISAPGGHFPAAQNQQVYSTLPGNGYGYDVGTSMACPHVSGVAALILSKYGHSMYTPDLLRRRLLTSASSLAELEPTFYSQMGSGLLNAYQALQWISTVGIKLTPTSTKILDKRTAQLSVEVYPSNASSKKVKWLSDNPECVSVDSNGLIQAFYDKGSSANITARTIDGDFTATCKVSVYREHISMKQATLKILEKQKVQLLATIEPTNIEDRQILWRSSDPTIVSVDVNGNIEALGSNGESAKITAYTNDGDLETTCTVLVYKDIVVPDGFSPNSDGHNDFFEIALLSNIKYTLKVFDKSGQQYYESQDYMNDWNGIANRGALKGKKVPVGTYYYVLTDNEGLVKKGYIVIKY